MTVYQFNQPFRPDGVTVYYEPVEVLHAGRRDRVVLYADTHCTDVIDQPIRAGAGAALTFWVADTDIVDIASVTDDGSPGDVFLGNVRLAPSDVAVVPAVTADITDDVPDETPQPATEDAPAAETSDSTSEETSEVKSDKELDSNSLSVPPVKPQPANSRRKA